MTKKLLLLNGLAILMIPLQHAGGYGFQAMFEWTDRYRQVTSLPNFDLLGTPAYYGILVLRQLATFSVPSFLFISGYFLAFLARGKDAKVTWSKVLPRIKVLLFPFVIWTVIRYAFVLRSWPTSLDDLLDPYAFVPILIQFYLLSPLLVPIARKRWKLFLAIFALMHLALQVTRALNSIDVHFPGQVLLLTATPRWFFLGQQPFWFPFGLVFGLHFQKYTEQLVQLRPKLLVGTVILFVLSIVEYLVADTLNPAAWIGPTYSGVALNFYIIAAMLLILSLDESKFPYSKTISDLGTKSLGIYMGNIPAIFLTAFMMYHLTSWALGVQLLYVPILFTAGLGGPLLFMWIVRKTPLRPAYRYLFG